LEDTQSINREEILDDAILESELSDLKQHADKMIRGFENFNGFSSNRAIWELIQNACDLSKNCEVIIDYSNNGFSFTHNGKPFTTKSFISLIKQVSGKYGEETEIPEVGKYGTGFLTTHTFGRKFLINSVLEAKNTFFEIKDFLIDRSPKEWKQMSVNIKNQKENVYQLIKDGSIISNPSNRTTFTFRPESTQEFNYILESRKDLEDYVPIVLTLNERLKRVSVINDESRLFFERVEKMPVVNTHGINLFKTIISKNGQEKVLFSIIEEEDQIEVILPVNEKNELFLFPDRVARLFLYYPLIGSEDFGLNFIINCNQFLPTEPRDGIHLMSNKEQVEEQEQENRRIIEKASTLIFDFLKSNIITVSNPLLYAKINFKRNSENALLNGYFENLQRQWTEEYYSLPIVETEKGFISVKEACFFKAEILNSITCFEEIYEIASTFKDNLPVKNKIALWSQFVNDWTNENIKLIGHEDLVSFISEKHLSDFEKTNLINYYKELINEERINFFSEYTLLPNLDGKFFHLPILFESKDLTETLIEIGKILIPQHIEKLIHKDFCFNFPLGKFDRKDFSSGVKTTLDEKQVSSAICLPETINLLNYNTIDDTVVKKLDYDFFTSLIKYCKLNSNLNSQSKPTSLVKILSRYYKLDDNLIQLSNLGEQESNLDIRSARKILVQVFFNLLQYHNEKWVENNISLLLEIANCNEDRTKELFLSSNVYPNQLNQLKNINDLKRDIDVSIEIKDLYDKVTKDTIREDLIYPQFNHFVPEDRYITNKYLTTQIEEVFFNTDIKDINEHPFKEDILTIISKLREKNYAELFHRLDDKKANLMLDIVTNENTKDDIFSIVTLKESQLKKLGKLVQVTNFESILNTANALIEQQIERESDFRHKYEIGTNIERIIREKLSSQLQERISFENGKFLEASNTQGGQDIIVLFDGNPIYFIEVKSRWNSSNSVSMSKLQLQRAVEENECYALCSVDITKYMGNNDRYNLPMDEVLPLAKFVTNIGGSIKPLIEDNLVAEQNMNESIHLIDYRGIIPQEIIKSGKDFYSFIDSLSILINELANRSIKSESV
jgi:hypothetical protein